MHILGGGGAGIRTVGTDGKIGTLARPELFYATALTVDRDRNLYIADTGNRRILKVTPQATISVVAGTKASSAQGRGLGFSGDGGPAAQGELSFPLGVAIDADGNLYLADSENHRVRRVNRDGIIETVAGTGAPGFAGDGGVATAAQLNAPAGLAIDHNGNLWIVDSGNHRLRKMTPDQKITTVAGTGTRGFAGDGGPAANAQLNFPIAVAVDSHGNAFVADSHNYRVRKITPDGTINTVLVAGPGQEPFRPADVAIDRAGNVLVADPFNHRVWKVTGVAASGLIAGQPFP
jgi:sugar lactone lactonase YvrE